MANKNNYKQPYIKAKEEEKKRKRFEENRKILLTITLIFVISLFACFFANWSHVYNTDYGIEVGVNAWQYLIALMTWNFKGTGALYGDIAVPFYYYAKELTMVLSFVTAGTFLVLLATTVVTIINFFKHSRKIEIANVVLLYVLSLMFIACIVVAFTMSGSRILPVYCSGNPKCSIGTLAFFPLVITLIPAIAHTIFFKKNPLE